MASSLRKTLEAKIAALNDPEWDSEDEARELEAIVTAPDDDTSSKQKAGRELNNTFKFAARPEPCS